MEKENCCPICKGKMIYIKGFEVDQEGNGHIWYQLQCPLCNFESDYFESKEEAINDVLTRNVWKNNEEAYSNELYSLC